MKNLKKILVFIIWLIILFPNNINANQIKILVKINNELITNVDVENEYKYLSALNESLKDLKKEKILKFAKDSLIREKVKKNEILKYYELNQKNETVDLMIEKIYQAHYLIRFLAFPIPLFVSVLALTILLPSLNPTILNHPVYQSKSTQLA